MMMVMTMVTMMTMMTMMMMMMNLSRLQQALRRVLLRRAGEQLPGVFSTSKCIGYYSQGAGEIIPSHHML